MLFNSIEFALFLPLVFILYWIIGSDRIKMQNSLLLLASYIFYGWWDWRFLALIVFSSSVDYFIGLAFRNNTNPSKRKLLLYASLAVNLGLLGFFKYFNFFIDSFSSAFTFFGSSIDSQRLTIILPLGISFYTLQTLSYSIDSYNKKVKPTTDALSFFTYVSFFPQLVAGPIERAKDLLPQFQSKRNFKYENGLSAVTQIMWGLFKKVVIADNCAIIVNQIFSDYSSYSGSTLLMGAILFAFQIYGDFSGYSDMAIGIARLFGIKLKTNFSYPFFSRDINEFWRRWHISLSTWFRDYVYIPLGGNKGNLSFKARNILIVFLISGLWHGANWTYVFWGLLNAIFVILLFFRKDKTRSTTIVAEGKILPSFIELVHLLKTFLLVAFFFIFFRSDSIMDAFEYILILCSSSLFTMPYVFGIGMTKSLLTFTLLLVLLVIEWQGREKIVPIYTLYSHRSQWVICFLLGVVIFLFAEQQQEFIYFQF